MTPAHQIEPVVGARLGIDVGRARVGMAASDPAGILASPVSTLTRDTKSLEDLHAIVDEARQRRAVRVYVGDPINLKGQKTASTDDAHHFAQQLADLLAKDGQSAQVRLIDERLSTVSATQKLRQAGVSSRDQRSVIDQLAAVAILDHAMLLEQRTGTETGTHVTAHQEDAV